MLHQITRKINYSYRQFADFIHEENLKTEALLTAAVVIFLIVILYS